MDVYQVTVYLRIGRLVEEKESKIIIEVNEVGVKWALVKRSKFLRFDENFSIKAKISPDLLKDRGRREKTQRGTSK